MTRSRPLTRGRTGARAAEEPVNVKTKSIKFEKRKNNAEGRLEWNATWRVDAGGELRHATVLSIGKCFGIPKCRWMVRCCTLPDYGDDCVTHCDDG